MPRTEQDAKQNAAPSKSAEAALDDALDHSFPASDPLSATPRRGGKHDRKAPTTDADRPQGLRGVVNRVKERLKH